MYVDRERNNKKKLKQVVEHQRKEKKRKKKKKEKSPNGKEQIYQEGRGKSEPRVTKDIIRMGNSTNIHACTSNDKNQNSRLASI